MALATKKGSFAARTSGGAQSVSGLGFTPKAVLLWVTKQTATGYAAGRALSFGFTNGTAQACISTTGNDGATTASNVAGRAGRSDRVISVINYAAGSVTTDIRADITSLDSDGFTLNWIVAAVGKDYVIHYWALGGSDLTNAYVGSILTPATTPAAVGYTGFGFQPDFLMAMTLGATVVGDFTGGRIQIGAASSTTDRASVLFESGDTIPTTAGSKQIVTKLCDWTDGAGTILFTGDLQSFDADGVTIDWTTVQSTQRIVFVLALKGGRYWVGSDTQKTSAGTQAKTGVGFTPSGLLLMGTNRATSTSFDATLGKFSLGASDGTTEGAVWMQSTDNVSTTDENTASVTDKILRHATNASTTDAEADLSSLDSDGYTLNWTTADATAREFVGVAVGSAAAAAPGPTLRTVQSTLRW